MRKNIFLYLFVFAGLIALYLGISGGNAVENLEGKLQKAEQANEELEARVQELQIKVLDMQYFSLENNDDALAYYDDLDLEDPSAYIADKLLETNEQSGDNPLVPYEGMSGDFKINKIKILNHRWIIADFSDGKYWGELLISYQLGESLGVEFTLIDHLLYTRSD